MDEEFKKRLVDFFTPAELVDFVLDYKDRQVMEELVDFLEEYIEDNLEELEEYMSHGN